MPDPRWDDVREAAEKGISEALTALERGSPVDGHDNLCRGEIRAYRAILALAEPKRRDPNKDIQPPAVRVPGGPENYGY